MVWQNVLKELKVLGISPWVRLKLYLYVAVKWYYNETGSDLESDKTNKVRAHEEIEAAIRADMATFILKSLTPENESFILTQTKSYDITELHVAIVGPYINVLAKAVSTWILEEQNSKITSVDIIKSMLSPTVRSALYPSKMRRQISDLGFVRSRYQ